jgi:hypothetical protein
LAPLVQITKLTDSKVLEYTLFQPSLFLNYFAYPYANAKHLASSPQFLDFQNRRAIQMDDAHHPIVVTTVQDLAAVVAEALDYESEWPHVGGITGTRTTIARLIKLGKRFEVRAHLLLICFTP